MPVLSFNANGGTSAPNSVTIPAATPYTDPVDNAEWEVNVTFDANGGTFYQGSSTRVQTFSIDTNEWALSEQDAESGNVAYYTDSNHTLIDYITQQPIEISADTELYAVWFGQIMRLTELPIEENSTGNISERDAYKFDRDYPWTYTLNGNDPVTIPVVLTHDITIYAKWEYRICFNFNDGYSVQGPPYYCYANIVSDTNSVVITNAVADYLLHDIVVTMPYRASGYDHVEITVTDGVVSATYRRDFGSGHSIYGGSYNTYTGELTSAYNPDGSPISPWDVETIAALPVYTPDASSSIFTVSTDVGLITTLIYYTSITPDPIVFDEGPVIRWKQHGVTYQSPYSIDPVTGRADIEREGYNFAGWSTNPSPSSAQYVIDFTYSGNAPLEVYAYWTLKVWTVNFYDGYSPAGQDLLFSLQVANGDDVPAASMPQVGNVYHGKVFKKPGNYSLLGWSGPYDYNTGGLSNVTTDVNSSAIWDFAPIWIRVMEGGTAKWVSYKPSES